MKTGLVLEGGAMRGMYTAGVLDVLMEDDIHFDGIIGASAGAVFGVNYLSKQNGRVIRYNCRFNRDRNYMGIKCLLRTGDFFNTEYAYYHVPKELDIFDDETYKASGVPFYAVVTDVKTGQIVLSEVMAKEENGQNVTFDELANELATELIAKVVTKLYPPMVLSVKNPGNIIQTVNADYELGDVLEIYKKTKKNFVIPENCCTFARFFAD